MDGARSGLGCGSKDRPSARPAEGGWSPCCGAAAAAVAAAGEGREIACWGEKGTRCCRWGMRGMARLGLEEDSCIARSKARARDRMSGWGSLRAVVGTGLVAGHSTWTATTVQSRSGDVLRDVVKIDCFAAPCPTGAVAFWLTLDAVSSPLALEHGGSTIDGATATGARALSLSLSVSPLHPVTGGEYVHAKRAEGSQTIRRWTVDSPLLRPSRSWTGPGGFFA
jgi:hypothetical protein